MASQSEFHLQAPFANRLEQSRAFVLVYLYRCSNYVMSDPRRLREQWMHDGPFRNREDRGNRETIFVIFVASCSNHPLSHYFEEFERMRRRHQRDFE